MAAEVAENERRRGRARAGAPGPRYPGWLALPALAWYVLFFIGPLAIMGAYSFAEASGFTDVAFNWNLGNYRYLWDPLYGEIFLRTLKLALIGTAATLLIGFPFAYYLARYAKHKTLLLMLVIVPFWTSFLIRTYSWLIMLDPEFPLFRALGIGRFVEDAELLYTTKAIYIGVVYNYLPLMILPLYAALERLDGRLLEAAHDLYGTRRAVLWRVTLPLTAPGIVAGSMLTFIPAAGDFINAELLGTPRQYMIGNVIQSRYLELTDYPTAAALSFTLMALILVLVLVWARVAGTESLMGSSEP